ncbi:hypothetical protein [Bartonella apis]|uniref:hypothetical protein n=1 Tax=Bartonella apis TaxID=1686310 RepID=UPI00242D5800|nr:hypothetical protein [Bartonella apis]
MDKDKLIDVKQTFALWCALTAARSSPKCRFSNDEGAKIATNDLLLKFRTLDDLPDPIKFDDCHRKLRQKICLKAENIIEDKTMHFTHGVAAKFINVYFKAMFLNDVPPECIVQEMRINSLHPPIDRRLLKTLAKKKVGRLEKFWREKANKGWSNFSSDDYEDVIKHIKYVTKGHLWEIEEYWKIDDKDDKDDNNPKQRCL